MGRWLLRSVLKLLYRVRVTGLEHYAQAGQRVLIVANHTSFLDAALLAAFIPDRLTDAVACIKLVALLQSPSEPS